MLFGQISKFILLRRFVKLFLNAVLCLILMPKHFQHDENVKNLKRLQRKALWEINQPLLTDNVIRVRLLRLHAAPSAAWQLRCQFR